MSQKVRIQRVTVRGATPFLGLSDNDRPGSRRLYSRDPLQVMQWLCDGWRTRFNQLRSRRCRCGADRELLPIGGDPDQQTLAQARVSCTWLAAVPSLVAQSPEKIEKQDWFAAVKRRKALLTKRQNPGRMPLFRSRTRDCQMFVCWSNGGRNAILTRTGKRAGIVTITGQNPKRWARPGERQRFSIRIHVRLSEGIRSYSSVRVNWTRRELVFVNEPLPIQRRPTGSMVGVDRGVTHAMTDSNGLHADLPASRLRKINVEVGRRQKAQARAVRHSPYGTQQEYRRAGISKRFAAHDQPINQLRGQASRIVADHQHNWSTYLVRQHDLIVVENLTVRNMIKRPRPIPDPIRPGNYLPNGRIAQRGLNRVLRSAALSRFGSMLDYKAALAGVTVVAVDPRGTSQRCYACGHIASENRKSQAVFCCVVCGHRDNADTNAARNILDRGLRIARADQQDGQRSGVITRQGRAAPGVEKLSDGGIGTTETAASSVKREPLSTGRLSGLARTSDPWAYVKGGRQYNVNDGQLTGEVRHGLTSTDESIL